ncbi:MAG: transcription antitermination factor NusB [Chloroflexi bacterium]|nr:MAG: transcription antitermination factor NusB [Chloroflexota bacterium]
MAGKVRNPARPIKAKPETDDFESGQFDTTPANDGSGAQKSAYSQQIAQRRKARRAALQALYEIDTTTHKPGPVLEARQATARLEEDGLAFLRWLISGVVAHREDMDRLIARYAPEWPVDQLAVIDRNILRMSIFELLNPDSDAPSKVIVNEAVELAKIFGSDSSPRFVNGVLGTALKEIAAAS